MTTDEKKPSVLDRMTADILTRKEAKATTLTPVGMERNGPLAGLRTSAPFPNDNPQEVAQQALIDLDRVLDHLTQARTALADLAGTTSTTPVAEAEAAREEQRKKEREADEKFADRLARLQDEAKEQVFGGKPEPEPTVESVAPGTGWTCPTHGDQKLKVLTSGKGRVYTACIVEGCTRFEK